MKQAFAASASGANGMGRFSMETAVTGYYPESLPLQFEAPAQVGPRPRSKWAPLAFLLPLSMCAVSWAVGGMPTLTDAGFVSLTVICAWFCVVELVRFPRRNGVGALMLYGGVIVWFCMDYLTYWFNINFALSPLPPLVIAKAATLHCLFIMMMSAGLLLQYGKRLERWILKLPESNSSGYYFFLVILFFALGILPYLLFTEERFPDVFIKSITSMRGTADAVHWTVGRTGNVNYNWGGYVAQWVEAGYLGGLFAAFYAVLVAKKTAPKIVAWLIWGFWMAMSLGTGTRGQVVFMGLPVIALVYMKYQLQAAAQGRKLSLRAYVRSGGFLLLVLALVQFQGMFRGVKEEDRDVSQVELFKVSGNHMFSEGLLGYSLIPETRPFFYDRFPGEVILRPVPDFAFHLITHPIPRALWTSKPLDPLSEWYNATYTGRGEGREGTTISHGLVGSWYFKYGLAGVIEGGLLMGLLYSIAERALQKSAGRPMVIMMSLGLLTWLFRCFRDVTFPELWALLLGFMVLAGLVWLSRFFLPSRTALSLADNV